MEGAGRCFQNIFFFLHFPHTRAHTHTYTQVAMCFSSFAESRRQVVGGVGCLILVFGRIV